MCTSTAEEERARQELVVAHRLFQRYRHKDTAWLVEFLLGQWRRVLGLDRARDISQQARLTAGHLEDRGTPLTVAPETGEVLDLHPRSGPQPAGNGRPGRVNWTAFWAEAKRLGFEAKAVHALAGTNRLAHLDHGAIEDLLNLMRDKVEIAASESLPLEVEP